MDQKSLNIYRIKQNSVSISDDDEVCENIL